jgi:SIR2-like domain/NACHT domain
MNDKLPELKADLRAGNCLLFVGAGASIAAGMKSWDAVTAEMKAAILGVAESKFLSERQYLDGATSLEIAERFRVVMGVERYASFVSEHFENAASKPSVLHLWSVRASPQLIVTTNFDQLLEAAYLMVHGRLPRVVVTYPELASANLTDQPIILKLHGCVTRPETLVLCESDYHRLQLGDAGVLSFLRERQALGRALFLGYSMRDPDFRLLRYAVLHASVGFSKTDYAIVIEPYEAEVDYWRSRGIELLRASSPQGVLDILDNLISELPTETIEDTATSNTVSDFDIENLDSPFGALLPDVLVSRRIERRSAHDHELTLPQSYRELSAAGRLHLLVGSAGSGKTTILKALAARIVEDRGASAVLWVPLRELDSATIASLPQVLAGRDTGNAVASWILIDGLDEIPGELQASLAGSLAEAVSIIPESRVVLTSRTILPTGGSWTRWNLIDLTVDDLVMLSPGVPREALEEILNKHPDLVGRPIFGNALSDISLSVLGVKS